jgi:hypothetical protein
MDRFLGIWVTVMCLALTSCSSGSAGSPDTAAQSSPSRTINLDDDCPNRSGGACVGNLEPGTYHTSEFTPRITYTVPPAWYNDEDLPRNFLLYRQDDPQTGGIGGSYLGIYQNVNAAAINCDGKRAQGVGRKPEELVTWYQSVRGLIVSDPEPVSVGGLSGYQIDLSLVPGNKTCTYEGEPGIPLIIGNDRSQLHHVILHQIDVRLMILGWEDGNVTIEITNVKDQVSAKDYRAVVQPIVDSIKFG